MIERERERGERERRGKKCFPVCLHTEGRGKKVRCSGGESGRDREKEIERVRKRERERGRERERNIIQCMHNYIAHIL